MDTSVDAQLAPFPSLRGFASAAASEACDTPARLPAVLRVLAEAARAAMARPGNPAAPDAAAQPTDETSVVGVSSLNR